MGDCVTETAPLALLSGRYRLGEVLGRGGMAEVFDAQDLRLGRRVAVKMLHPHLADDSNLRSRFEQEARMVARLSHPNVVAVFDTGEDSGTVFIVMERLPGTTLAGELRGGPLELGRIRELAGQLLAALQAAHGAGVVHGDVKPANVLTCPDGTAKVADFGIAVAGDEAQSVTRTGLLVGTPAYLAPERLAGEPASYAADLYSLGAVLFECLAGRRPHEGDDTMALIASVRSERPPPVGALRPEADPVLARLVDRALEHDPALRPRSAAEMAAVLETEPPPAVGPAGAGQAPTQLVPTAAAPGRRRSRRSRRVGVAVLAAATALAVVLPLSLGGPSASPRPTGRRGVSVPAHQSLASVPLPLRRALDRLDTAVGR